MRWDGDSCSEADSDDASISSDDASDIELELELFPATAGAVSSEDEEMQIELMDEGIGNVNRASTLADGISDEEILVLLLFFIVTTVLLSQLDGEEVVICTDFFLRLREKQSLTAYRRTYNFGYGPAALLTCYGNGCGQDGDGICGAATQLGMSRTPALCYIQNIEKLLYDMLDDVVYFPAPTATVEWDAMVEGFAKKGGSDVACIFDGTLVRTRRPNEQLGFYDKSGKPSYNCLATIDHRNKFRYIGVFSGSNSDRSMWNQSKILGARARHLCPLGINWLGGAGFKIWPFLIVPYDERRGRHLTRKQRWSEAFYKASNV
ncbi:DDE superfamily endonuclease [Phytophthora infestans]|uniref:DDE superfamily endonuclease n=1 Tax=Phytophthora infestans TaxID=4787 RepID=A0A8S9UXF6_PHYIN|nr:DDE superfamily endonuclease [Phytophthora infestans]